jgi:dTDP-4-amino-4,6-dideoxygalactose transaminase
MTALPLPDRFDPVAKTEIETLSEALSTGLGGRSRVVTEYERRLEKQFDASHAIAVSSGFGALVVALSALGLLPGDRVLLTPTCPLCTAYALTFLRLEPVFCDIGRNDFSIALDHAERRFDARVRAIIDIPMWGYPVSAQRTASYALANGVAYVLDIALAHGCRLDGRPLWSFADVATLSTHSSKILVTGEGGAVLTDNADIASRARRFSYPDDAEVESPSLNYSIGGLQAALGLARLERLAPDICHRLETMRLICERLDNPHLEPLPIIEGGRASGTKLILREKLGSNTALLSHQRNAGVPSDIALYNCKPLYQYPVFASRTEYCPNAEAMLSSITTIPIHPDINSDAVRRIVKVLNAYRPQS